MSIRVAIIWFAALNPVKNNNATYPDYMNELQGLAEGAKVTIYHSVFCFTSDQKIHYDKYVTTSPCICICLHYMQVPFEHLFVGQMHEEFTYFVQKKERESKPPLASVEHCSDLIWKENNGHAYIAHNEDSDRSDIGYVVNACT